MLRSEIIATNIYSPLITWAIGTLIRITRDEIIYGTSLSENIISHFCYTINTKTIEDAIV